MKDHFKNLASFPQTPATLKSALRLVVLVSGRGTNLQAILTAIQNQKLKSQIVQVISNVPGAPALEHAQKAGIPALVIESKNRSKTDFFNEVLQSCLKAKPDLIVLAGFMKILPPEFIKEFPKKIINIHPSLLPDFPGLNAQEQALRAGVKITGCTVHYVDEGCDTGPIILQKTEPILPGDTSESLSGRLLVQEHAALIEALSLLEISSATE